LAAVPAIRATTPLQEIERQFDTGHYSEAKRTLETELAQSPQDARLHFWLARTHYEMLQFDGAINSAEQACQLDPANSDYRLWLARAVGRKAERERSFFLARRVKHELEEAVRLEPKNIRARRDLAEFYSDSPWIVGGSKSKARQQVEIIAQQDPIEGLLARADYFRNLEDPNAAAGQYRLLLERHPSSAAPYFEALDFFESRKDAPQIELFLASAARLAPADPRIAYYGAVARVFSGKELPAAEKALRNYLDVGPDRSDMPNHADAHERLGLLYEKLGGPGRAEAEYRVALASDPSRKRALDGLKRVTQQR
jgi:tetratricopeptide (TPR) repeat protein